MNKILRKRWGNNIKMTKQQLKRAEEIQKNIDALFDLRTIMGAAYPQFYASIGEEVNSATFDKAILKDLKKVIYDFTEGKILELEKEFENL